VRRLGKRVAKTPIAAVLERPESAMETKMGDYPAKDNSKKNASWFPGTFFFPAISRFRVP
jgi:hypothetical protein